MVGGDPEAFERVKPVFEALGKNIMLQGETGAGQHTKMCNQIAIASNMIEVCEDVAYARKAGLDPETVLKSIESGAAGSWSLHLVNVGNNPCVVPPAMRCCIGIRSTERHGGRSLQGYLSRNN